MIRSTIVILFLIAAFAANAQTFSIRGRVMSDSTPLAGATVEIRKVKQVVFSDAAGYFELLNIPAGNHMLHISVVGHEPFHENIKVNDNINERVFDLVANVSSLDGVVVTGTMRPVQRKESPILVEVYTPQFFKKNPVPSIFEALQNVNGVRPQLNCNVCNTGDIHINGLEGPLYYDHH